MATCVLLGLKLSQPGENGAVLYDDATCRAFGPVFDSHDEAKDFLSYLAEVDPADLDWGHPRLDLDREVASGIQLYRQWVKEGKPRQRPPFVFDDSWLHKPERGLTKTWDFVCEFPRTCFPLFLGLNNNDVGDILRRNKVLKDPDTEAGCFYAHFGTKKEGLAFLKRLNLWLRKNWYRAYPTKV